MRNLRLDKRLTEVVSLIDANDSVADVGCDHGKIAVSAYEKTGNRVIATDVSAPSLMKAQRLAFELGLDEEISFRVGDGLNVISPEEVNTAIIAGIGGNEIIKILQNSRLELEKYILVPHQHSEELCRYLLENGYGILRDYILECEKKFYRFFVASKTRSLYLMYSEQMIMFARENNADKQKYCIKRLEKLRGLLKLNLGNDKCAVEKEISILEEIVNEG